MKTTVQRARSASSVGAGLMLASLLLLLGVVPAAAEARAGSQVWGEDYFPNYELTAHTGEKLRFFDDVIEGKVVAVNFIFDLLGDRVGEDVFFYSITIDPEHDTVEVLREYAQRFGVDGERWKFLTGDKAEIDRIRASFGLYGSAAEEADLSNHNINLMLGNQATGQWMRRSPFENPYVLADQLGSWLHGGRKRSGTTVADYAEAPALRQISSGEMMFRDRCSSCHVISGGIVPARNARPLGPDLFAVGERRDPAWLRRWMAEPDRMLEEGDPIATAMYERYGVVMPNFQLTPGEIEALVDYMAAETDRLRAQHERAQARPADPHAAHREHDHAAHGHASHGHAPQEHGADDHGSHDHGSTPHAAARDI